ncbi:hypothetical protein [Aureicoccus marinus]|uniref:Uncharacterized protein n=1 Tax=Aureicoccus marinus TaxID=754435 RepID=A0A2S7T5M9_9FLAO|nr:hypothetical protein [Aureicoccus marinus]PQJ15232.1 hypothetical protein BST99_05360 [Aureicoccus marinus]
MNKFESLVYNAVKNNPIIKLMLRNAYQGVFDILPNRKDYSINPIVAKEGFFFGFHDLNPFHTNDSLLLANRYLIPKRMPNPGEELEVGYFNKNDFWSEFKPLARTKAWNYHKGCRLQWLDNESVIFNDRESNRFVSRIYHQNGEFLKTLDYPIDSCSQDGRMASSFSYERLEELMGGYGYPYADGEAFLEEYFPKQTGLFTIDIGANTRELLVSIEELKTIGEVPRYVSEQTHFVTHTLFSPDGRYLAFLHRSVKREAALKRWSRLLVYDLKKGECHAAPTDDMVSHYVWNEKNQIIAYCRLEGVDSHILFESPTMEKYRRVAYPRLNSDGHQSFASDTIFVTDTYPDKWRMAKLYLVDTKTNEVQYLASLNSLKSFQSIMGQHWACDLHPRMNHTGNMVCFDSVHTGKRALCLMPLS